MHTLLCALVCLCFVWGFLRSYCVAHASLPYLPPGPSNHAGSSIIRPSLHQYLMCCKRSVNRLYILPTIQWIMTKTQPNPANFSPHRKQQQKNPKLTSNIPHCWAWPWTTDPISRLSSVGVTIIHHNTNSCKFLFGFVVVLLLLFSECFSPVVGGYERWSHV